MTAWLSYNTGIVLAGTTLLGASAGLIGCFAVLRRRALLGDALAHASLPGVGIAFLLFEQRSLPILLAGALISGLLGVVVVAVLRFATRTKDDAAIGAVLGVSSALGFVLIRSIQDRTATGSKAGLASYILGKTAGMIAQDVYLVAAISAACLLLVLVFYKEFKAIAFDPGFARVQGWPVLKLDFLLTGLIAVAVVVGLPAVGGLLITALLIIPAVSARFWTDALGSMLVLSSVFGALIGGSGTLLSAQFSFSPAGPVIVLVGAALFTVSILAAPRRGVVARMLEERSFRRRFARQRLLRTLVQLEGRHAQHGRSFTLAELSAVLDLRTRRNADLSSLARAGLAIATPDGRFSLTDAGRLEGSRVLRSDRLWQVFLSKYGESAALCSDLDADDVDRQLPADLLASLERELVEQNLWPAALPQPQPTGPAKDRGAP